MSSVRVELMDEIYLNEMYVDILFHHCRATIRLSINSILTFEMYISRRERDVLEVLHQLEI